MIEVSYSGVQECLNKANLSQLPKLRVSVLRNIIVESVESYLRYLALQIGFDAQIRFGEYDNIFQEAVGGQSELLNEDSDVVLIFTYLDTLSWDLSRNFLALNGNEIEAEVDRIKEYISSVLSGIDKQTNAIVLWHGFDIPVHPSLGILDYQGRDGQAGVISGLNEFLRNSLSKRKNMYFVDMNLCLARVGAQQFHDSRYWHIGRAPFGREALREIAEEDFKFIRALKGKNKKCLVLDCDNTLWGGIIGEDGLSGIKLGKTYPGSAYYEFQQEILNLYNRGIIIAVCSKNNEGDVWEVFREHPDMVLEEKHIASYQINWDDKATNLRRIAQDLNIGLDSMVLIDDSDFEVHFVRQVLPEVEVIQLPNRRIVEYRNILSSCGLFDTLALSPEDRKRGAMYKAEVERQKMATQFSDIEGYYKSLEMVVTIQFADDFSIPRIAQLTQKTNQFNLTTKRYSEADIKALSESQLSDVFYLHLNDRFGDSGIVGVGVLKYEANEAVIDSFLLSCRVLGRGIEDVFLNYCLKLAQKRGKVIAVGQYIATQKNGQVREFYQKMGFQGMEKTENTSTSKVDLASYGFHTATFFKQVISEIDNIPVMEVICKDEGADVQNCE